MPSWPESSEKSSGVKKDFYQKTVRDIRRRPDFHLERDGVRLFLRKMGIDNTKSYPFVLHLFVEVADVLSSAEYREFAGNILGGHEYMAHTLITYLFNIFYLFVKVVELPADIRYVKVCNELDMKHVKMPIMIQRK